MKRAALIAVMLAGIAAIACGRSERTAREMTGGDPQRGEVAIRRYGCGACHEIEGVAGATGRVGPPLSDIASRSYLAGQLPNEPQNLIKWIRDPQSVSPGTAMPDMRLTDQDARDIAAYLYTLR